MNKTEFATFHKGVCEEALDLASKKNADYSPGDDAFKNFRQCEGLGVCDAATGCFVRLSDKFSRLAALMQKNPTVASESFRDTAIDAINYLIILLVLRCEARDRPMLSGEVDVAIADLQRFTAFGVEDVQCYVWNCPECGFQNVAEAAVCDPLSLRCSECATVARRREQRGEALGRTEKCAAGWHEYRYKDGKPWCDKCNLEADTSVCKLGHPMPPPELVKKN